MIHAVRFRNFKALRDVELALDRFTILVGPNASGKTSVLEGLYHLTRLATVDPRTIFDGRTSIGVIASRGAEGVFQIALQGTFRRKKGELAISFSAIEDFPFSDTYRLDCRWGDRRVSLRRELNPPDDAPREESGELPLALVLREAAYLRFDLNRLATPSYSDLPTPVIGTDGRGLAAVIADMAVSRPDDFSRLQDALRAVIPGLLRVRLVRAKVPHVGPESDSENKVWGHEVVFDMAGATDIPARAASEGMLLMLGLFATLLGPDRQDLVLIDRLERAVNPRSLGELTEQINQILALDPRLQIIATSDSPSLLDHMNADAIRVHCLLEDGSVRIKPLSAHPDHELLSSDLRPGEFWAQVGDAWIAESSDDDGEVEDEGEGAPDASDPPAEVDAQEVVDDDAANGAAPGKSRWPPSMPPLPPGVSRL